MKYLSHSEILKMVQETSEGKTHREMAGKLGVSRPAVTKMLAGEKKLIRLAIKWINLTLPTGSGFQLDESGDPEQYFLLKK